MRTIQEIEQQLPGAAENGLTSAAAAESAARHGLNRLTPLPREPIWKKFLEKFDEPIINILLAAALLSMLVDLFKALDRSAHVIGGVGVGLLALGLAGLYATRRSQWVPSFLFVLALLL